MFRGCGNVAVAMKKVGKKFATTTNSFRQLFVTVDSQRYCRCVGFLLFDRHAVPTGGTVPVRRGRHGRCVGREAEVRHPAHEQEGLPESLRDRREPRQVRLQPAHHRPTLLDKRG